MIRVEMVMTMIMMMPYYVLVTTPLLCTSNKLYFLYTE